MIKKSLILPGLLTLMFFCCQKADPGLRDNVWDEYQSPAITQTTLYDTLPGKFLTDISIQGMKGVKATYASGKYTCYFQYDAPESAVLRMVSRLPFRKSEAADSICRKMEKTFSLNGRKILSDEEVKAASFFWDIDPKEFTFYECLKGGQRHTILVHSTTGLILHRIEFYPELS